MFTRLGRPAPSLWLTIDGRPVMAVPGETVTSAMLAAGLLVTRRSPVDGNPRGPYCGMGVCFECLVDIDGLRRQACLTPVRAGMVVETGTGDV